MAERGALEHINEDAFAVAWARREIPVSKIAQALGVTNQAVSLHAKKRGLPSRRGNRETVQKSQPGLFRRMWEAGVTSQEMAQHFGYSHCACVSVRRRKMGLPARPRDMPTITLAEFQEIELARQWRESVEGGVA